MTRHQTIAAARMALHLAVAAAMVTWPGQAGTQEAQPPDQGAGAPAAKGEPEFTPGIPGLKMADVRDHKHLWREIQELQSWERGDRITVAEYRSKVIEKTAHFLELRGEAADEFAEAATAAIAAIRESFLKGRAGTDLPAAESQFDSDLGGAVNRLAALLQPRPRHRLFAPECKKWLLKLAFGPREAKESREAKQAQAHEPGKRD